MKKTRKVAVTVLVLFIMQLFYGIGYGDIVKAEENVKIISKVEVTDLNKKPFGKEIEKSSGVRMVFNFNILNLGDVKEREIFTVRLPEEIESIKNAKDILMHDGETGDLVATARFNSDGKTIDIEFTKFASENSNVFCEFIIYSKFDENKLEDGGEKVLNFQLGANTVPITIDFKKDPIVEPSIKKEGYYNTEDKELIWTIIVNSENEKVINAKVIDNILSGQKYVDGSFKIDGVDPDNNFNYVADESNNSEKSGTLTYTFPEIIDKEYIISFRTKITDPSILATNQGEKAEINNKAILNVNGKDKESNIASAYVTTNYIEKDGNYDSAKKEINWTIKVNNNEVNIKDLKVEDIIPKGLELIKDSFKVNNETNSNYQYDEVNKKLDFTFNGTINTQQIITFSTKVIDEKVYQSNGTKYFENTATIVGGLEGQPSASDKVGVGSNILKKSAIGQYDAKNHYLKWEIEVNSNEVELVNPVITDNIPIGQKYVNGSFKIEGEDADISGLDYSDVESKDGTGTITYSFNKTIDKKYTITFQTEITDSSVYAGNVINKVYSNTATMNADNIKEVNSEANQNVTSNVIDKQSKSYDYENKIITWKIVVNNNKTKLKDVVVTDNIPLGQEFLPKDFKIEKIIGDNKKEEVDVDKLGFRYYPNESGDNGITGTLTYTFNDEINDTYEITFTTKIADESIFHTNGQKAVKNKAYITGDVIPLDVSKEAEQKINNSVINKTAIYTNYNDYVDWSIDINSNSIPMGEVEIEDDLEAGLSLDITSVKLYHGVIDFKLGTLSKGEPVELNEDNIEYNADTRKFKFIFSEDVKSPYILEFRTDIVDPNKKTVSNTASFRGTGISQESKVDGFKVEFNGSESSAGGTTGSITVNKVDDESGKKLVGAKFNLLDKYKKNVLGTAITGNDGTLTFKKIRFDIPYYVEEVSPAEGYTLRENREDNIKEVIIDSKDSTRNISVEFKNTIIKANLELLKLDENNKTLKGAEFTIYDVADEEVTKGRTDENGVVKFENLVYGNYYYVETEAPEGYVLDSTRHDFTISENGVDLKEDVKNEKILGNIKVLKVDEDNKFLPNAEITLFDLKDEKIKSLVTDENGEVTFENIPYGEYKIKETKAPEG
ncbi:MAG: hypothetical protein KIC47_13055, partial [Clostridium sp.]|nr:hypothetical protein [Clostridium sp.]